MADACETQAHNFQNSLSLAFLVAWPLLELCKKTPWPPLRESKELTWTSSQSGGLQKDKSSQTFPLESYTFWVKQGKGLKPPKEEDWRVGPDWHLLAGVTAQRKVGCS